MASLDLNVNRASKRSSGPVRDSTAANEIARMAFSRPCREPQAIPLQPPMVNGGSYGGGYQTPGQPVDSLVELQLGSASLKSRSG